MSYDRRTFLKAGAAAGAGLLLGGAPRAAAAVAMPAAATPALRPLLRRPIPRTGELLPVIGLGSVSFFNLRRGGPEWVAAREVVALFHELGGRVLDTAPGYPEAEPFLGETLQDRGIADEMFIATKFNALQLSAGAHVRASGGAAADAAVMDGQLAESLRRFGRRRLDLQQVWNLGDVQSNAQRSTVPAGQLAGHMAKAVEWKEAGLTRYIGVTTSRAPQYAELEDAMRRDPLDFIQIDYSIDNVAAADRLLPAAHDLGVAVLVNRPFGSGALFRRAAETSKTLPAWAAELGITSWAQYFLKFIVAHPAVTAVIPATGNPRNLRDNMGAGSGALPDDALRTRMLDYWRA
jgi:aryl-alcohol dehydrogenase-like predicted oxidoreductase